MKVALLLVLSCNVFIADAACPLGYSEWTPYCYFLSSDKLPWIAANAFCNQRNAYLGSGFSTSVENAFENSVLSGVSI